MGSIGLPELLIVLFVVLLILGPKRLPALGRSLGGGLREFKDSIRRSPKEAELTAGTSTSEREALDGEVVPDSRR
ncbi:MAG: sec-independent protein translocase protein TatA [Solirubrobacteraceae bacterium]|jgi:sec-independent protein translocase protein TatA|nr:sec-independent protein translocase protein TatA [Solirubrobacteraceae bacterium]